MSIAAKYNKGGIDWGIDTKEFEFKKLSEFNVGEIIPVRGLFIVPELKFGDAVAMITDDCNVNLPVHMVDTVKCMLQDQEVIDEIKAGKVGAKVQSYTPKKFPDKTAYSVEWVDL